MTTIIEVNDSKILLIKGASELILDCCTEFEDFSGNSHTID